MSESVFPQPERITKFPDGSVLHESFNIPKGGLTKRELFSAMAMQAMVQTATANQFRNSHIDLPDPKTVAPWAIGYADALIAALGASNAP